MASDNLIQLLLRETSRDHSSLHCASAVVERLGKCLETCKTEFLELGRDYWGARISRLERSGHCLVGDERHDMVKQPLRVLHHLLLQRCS